jgi:hypothetical protein
MGALFARKEGKIAGDALKRANKLNVYPQKKASILPLRFR